MIKIVTVVETRMNERSDKCVDRSEVESMPPCAAEVMTNMVMTCAGSMDNNEICFTMQRRAENEAKITSGSAGNDGIGGWKGKCWIKYFKMLSRKTY